MKKKSEYADFLEMACEHFELFQESATRLYINLEAKSLHSPIEKLVNYFTFTSKPLQKRYVEILKIRHRKRSEDRAKNIFGEHLRKLGINIKVENVSAVLVLAFDHFITPSYLEVNATLDETKRIAGGWEMDDDMHDATKIKNLIQKTTEIKWTYFKKIKSYVRQLNLNTFLFIPVHSDEKTIIAYKKHFHLTLANLRLNVTIYDNVCVVSFG